MLGISEPVCKLHRQLPGRVECNPFRQPTTTSADRDEERSYTDPEIVGHSAAQAAQKLPNAFAHRRMKSCYLTTVGPV